MRVLVGIFLAVLVQLGVAINPGCLSPVFDWSECGGNTTSCCLTPSFLCYEKQAGSAYCIPKDSCRTSTGWTCRVLPTTRPDVSQQGTPKPFTTTSSTTSSVKKSNWPLGKFDGPGGFGLNFGIQSTYAVLPWEKVLRTLRDYSFVWLRAIESSLLVNNPQELINYPEKWRLHQIHTIYGNRARVIVVLPNSIITRMRTDSEYLQAIITVLEKYDSIVEGVSLGNEWDCRNIRSLNSGDKPPIDVKRDLIPAMNSLIWWIKKRGVAAFVTTTIGCSFQGFPPPSCTLRPELKDDVTAVVDLIATQSPWAKTINVNMYPYVQFADGYTNQPLGFGLGVLAQKAGGVTYNSMLEQMWDCRRMALDNIRTSSGSFPGRKLEMVIGETGWVSMSQGTYDAVKLGNTISTIGNQQQYWKSSINLMSKGTTLFPGPKKGFWFREFDQELASVGSAAYELWRTRFWGLFFLSGNPKFKFE